MNDDYISRKEALSRFSFYQGDRIPEKDIDGFDNTISFKDAKAVIRSISPAEVRPVVYGEWKTNSDRPDTLICSVCGSGYDMWKHDPHNFCPNCGADMRGEKA